MPKGCRWNQLEAACWSPCCYPLAPLACPQYGGPGVLDQLPAVSNRVLLLGGEWDEVGFPLGACSPANGFFSPFFLAHSASRQSVPYDPPPLGPYNLPAPPMLPFLFLQVVPPANVEAIAPKLRWARGGAGRGGVARVARCAVMASYGVACCVFLVAGVSILR